MNWVINGHNIMEIILVTFFVSLILVPLAKKIANKRTTQKFLSEFADIKKIIENNKLDKKRYTDSGRYQNRWVWTWCTCNCKSD